MSEPRILELENEIKKKSIRFITSELSTVHTHTHTLITLNNKKRRGEDNV